MTTETTSDNLPENEEAGAATPRKRPKPGERRLQILQTLAGMLEQPGAERITTAALSAKLGVSEAALYRHFASKAQMFILQFAEKNPGMARVMTGDALVFENERLQERMNLLFDKLESTFKQALRDGGIQSDTPTVDAQVTASLLVAFMMGRMQRFARSGFKRLPSENLQASLARVL
ncbi:MAG: nucleoid occlusion factor SlmA [Betaproteobacteria bacterium]|nr:nucleoid occlusion factor SlmA [Betaproteobacteria bacterium]